MEQENLESHLMDDSSIISMSSASSCSSSGSQGGANIRMVIIKSCEEIYDLINQNDPTLKQAYVEVDNDQYAVELEAALRGNTELQRITLRIGSDVTLEGAERLDAIPLHEPKLIIDEVILDAVSDEHVPGRVFRALSNSTEMNCSICMQETEINRDAFVQLKHMFECGANVTHCMICEASLSDDAYRAFALALSATQKLGHLCICFMQISDGAAECLSLGLGGGCPLKELRFESVAMGERGVESLAAAFQSNTSLEKFFFSNAQLSMNAAYSLGVAFEVNESITEIHFENAGITDYGTFSISEAIRVNNTLKVVRLEGNNITSHGAEFIANAMLENRSVVCLDLSKNLIGKTGATALAGVLEVNRKLARLDISHNRSRRGMKSNMLRIGMVMADAIPRMVHLRCLIMDGCGRQDIEFLLSLCRGLRHNTVLRGISHHCLHESNIPYCSFDGRPVCNCGGGRFCCQRQIRYYLGDVHKSILLGRVTSNGFHPSLWPLILELVFRLSYGMADAAYFYLRTDVSVLLAGAKTKRQGSST